MVRNEWGMIVKQIRAFYPRYNFMEKQDTFEAWFEMLEDLEYAGALRAVQNYVKENQYPPTIADIRQEYNRMYEAYKTLVREVKKEFGLACQYYPSVDLDTKSEAFDVFFTKLKKHPQGEWIALTRRFNNSTTSFVRDCEVNHKAIPKFKDYVNEQTI